MKHFYLLILAVTLFMTSCNHDDGDAYYPETTPTSLIGTTFTDGTFFITIENSTTVSYFVPTYPDLKGKAKYTFQHGIFRTINPYGHELALADVPEPYMPIFEGTFNVRNKLDCNYTVIGKSGSVQVFGGGEMWKLEKDKP